MMTPNMSSWLRWISDSLPGIDPDARVEVPPHLPHPAASGFLKPALAEPHGQLADYVLSLADKTRVHLHEMGPGDLRAHRESDPGQGLLPALRHVALETTAGRATTVALLLLAIFGGFGPGSGSSDA